MRFLSRVTFICNTSFLVALILLRMERPPEGELISLLLVSGTFLAFLLTVIVNIGYALHLLFRKKWSNPVPRWLMVANAIFLVPELILLLK